MEKKYLHQVLPFMKELNSQQREQLENYFMSAPVWLMDAFKIVEMEKGFTFVRENAPVDTIYIIGKGMIKLIDYRIYGIVYDYMRFEGIYAMGGMEVVMDLDTYSTTLQTVTPCTMITIPKAKFEKWLKTDIKALKQEAKAVGEYLLQQGRMGRTFLFLQGADRLCMLFIQRYEQYGRGKSYNIQGTRQELAEQTGLCVKTINRCVKKFEEESLISRRGNKIFMNEEQYLEMKARISKIIEQE